MLIGSQQRLSTLNDVEKLSIEVNGCVLANVESEKLLGVYIDPRLSWNTHIDHIYSVVSSIIALLRRIKSFIDKDTCILYYKGYILPILDYCSAIWGTVAKEIWLLISSKGAVIYLPR